MIASPFDQFANFGRGAYDTTGVPKPPPPKPSQSECGRGQPMPLGNLQLCTRMDRPDHTTCHQHHFRYDSRPFTILDFNHARTCDNFDLDADGAGRSSPYSLLINPATFTESGFICGGTIPFSIGTAFRDIDRVDLGFSGGVTCSLCFRNPHINTAPAQPASAARTWARRHHQRNFCSSDGNHLILHADDGATAPFAIPTSCGRLAALIGAPHFRVRLRDVYGNTSGRAKELILAYRLLLHPFCNIFDDRGPSRGPCHQSHATTFFLFIFLNGYKKIGAGYFVFVLQTTKGAGLTLGTPKIPLVF
ncbi:hypothetical protein VTH06DRAFT_5066 [Thermothelomyces fergusii]